MKGRLQDSSISTSQGRRLEVIEYPGATLLLNSSSSRRMKLHEDERDPCGLNNLEGSQIALVANEFLM